MLGWSLIETLVRNWAIVAIAFTIVTLIVVPLLIILKYVRISLNIMRTTKPPLSRNPLDFSPMTGEPVAFPAYDGLPLEGMLIPAPDDVPRRGMVVFAHEFYSDMHSCARYCRAIHEAGYDIFTFDFRAHGQSEAPPDYTPRQWVSDREMDDMRGAIAWVQSWLEEHGLSRRLGIVGVSRGGCAAVLAAHENPDVAALFVDGAFSTDTTIEHFMKRWAYIFARIRVVYENHPPVFWRFLRWSMMIFARREFKCRFPSVRKAIKRMIPRPMFFVHGEKDSYLPVDQSRRLFALAGQPKALWIAAGARHSEAAIRHPEAYARYSVEFFDAYLSEPSEPPPVVKPVTVPAAPVPV
ncbi:MAG: alpha/beta fold hydrolase [Phycisphaerae bacterium]|nr:alpha/beta fold hydrolase [Phycisphaerae bacterium]